LKADAKVLGGGLHLVVVQRLQRIAHAMEGQHRGTASEHGETELGRQGRDCGHGGRADGRAGRAEHRQGLAHDAQPAGVAVDVVVGAVD
jgi:hypothetical protein